MVITSLWKLYELYPLNATPGSFLGLKLKRADEVEGVGTAWWLLAECNFCCAKSENEMKWMCVCMCLHVYSLCKYIICMHPCCVQWTCFANSHLERLGACCGLAQASLTVWLTQLCGHVVATLRFCFSARKIISGVYLLVKCERDRRHIHLLCVRVYICIYSTQWATLLWGCACSLTQSSLGRIRFLLRREQACPLSTAWDEDATHNNNHGTLNRWPSRHGGHNKSLWRTLPPQRCGRSCNSVAHGRRWCDPCWS